MPALIDLLSVFEPALRDELTRTLTTTFEEHIAPVGACEITPDVISAVWLKIQEIRDGAEPPPRLTPEEVEKTRYPQIPFYPDSKVELDSGAFIHANHMPNGFTQKTILTQAPIPNSFDDFWRMIWKNDVPVIVMLTDFEESGRDKADLYWPEASDGAKKYGDITVSKVSLDEFSDGTSKRVFKLECGDQHRFVTHIFCYSWRDSTALSMHDFQRLSQTVDAELPSSDAGAAAESQAAGPLVVHCSAGNGRAGTFYLARLIAEMEMKHIKTPVDCLQQLATLVLAARTHRRVVQMPEQFQLLLSLMQQRVSRPELAVLVGENPNQLWRSTPVCERVPDVSLRDASFRGLGSSNTALINP